MRRIRKITKGNKIIQYLHTVPGVELVTAFTFYTEIIDIFRFQTLDHLISGDYLLQERACEFHCWSCRPIVTDSEPE